MSVTNKYSFKTWYRRNYPEGNAEPIYGLDAYITTAPMNEFDAFTYYQTALDNGRYIVFIGMKPDAVSRSISEIKKNGLPERPANNRRPSATAPSTFSSFESWLVRNKITYLHRAFQSRKSAQEVLAPLGDIENIRGCKDVYAVRTWYLYELDCDEHYFAPLPHSVVGNKTYVLIKASNSRYVSKKERLSSNFQNMQSYMEQLIVALSKDDRERAESTATMYCSTLFECPVEGIAVDYQDMQKELADGKLGIYLRDKPQRVQSERDAFDSEDF